MDKGKKTDVERAVQETARLNAELDQLLSQVSDGSGSGRPGAPASQDAAEGNGRSVKQTSDAALQGRVSSDGARVLGQRNTDEKAGKRRRQHKVLRALAGILCVLILLLGAAAGSFWYLREQGRKALLTVRPDEVITGPEGAKLSADGSYVTYQGKHYMRNDNIVRILIMGIDRDESETGQADSRVAGEQGQADTILVGALDTETGSLKLINISRDSMVDVDLYNVEGGFAGVEEMQICLAYAYGDGKHESCLNVGKSVSRLLYGITMDAYVSLDLPAVNVLNDALGGVTVEVLEDLSAKDPALEKGARVTLNGDQARIYVRSRDHESLDANNARMARQRQYLIAFLEKVQDQARRNLSIVLSLYQAARTYMVTSLDLSRTAYLASVALTKDIDMETIVTVPGTVEEGEKFAEYRVDDEALYQIILDTFYEETQSEEIEILTEGDQENDQPAIKPEPQTGPTAEEGSTAQTQNTGDVPQTQETGEEDDGRITVDPNILH